ncbi:Cuticle-degrading protease [Chytriomyces hyalinus]|nr:Cuticle-degrading protease [Chytriomyces hyalinus]
MVRFTSVAALLIAAASAVHALPMKQKCAPIYAPSAPAPTAAPTVAPTSAVVVPPTSAAPAPTTTQAAPEEPSPSAEPSPEPSAEPSAEPSPAPAPAPAPQPDPEPAPQPQPEPQPEPPAPAPQPEPQPEPQPQPQPQPDPQPQPQQPDASQITSKDRQDLLDLHNSYRSQNGVSARVTYNDDVAAQAAVRAARLAANACQLEHGDLTSPKRVGQNLSMKASSQKFDAPMSDLVSGWSDETHAENEYNHATQMLWATSTQIGCAKAYGNGGGRFPYCEVLVCDYYPPGNMVGSSWRTGN